VVGKLKQLLAIHAPGPLVLAAWSLRRSVTPSPAQRFQKRIYTQLGEPHEVLRGPFKGMRYVRQCYGGSTLNRTLALYELELHPWIERMVAANPDVVIDIGTSDGYYLVGLARRLPQAHVIGFDAVRLCQTITQRVARLNGVQGRTVIRGFCTAEDLQRSLEGAQRPAVLCDCDSGELQVMDPQVAPALRRATILLEVHDNIQPGISAQMRRRFAPTHDIVEIPSLPRRDENFPKEYRISHADAAAVMEERRPPGNFWLYLSPKSTSQGRDNAIEKGEATPEVIVLKTGSPRDRQAPASR
jgi:hypothetical protein